MAISEYRPFIRALFHFGPKLGVPATLVVPFGSEIEKEMLSRPGRVIVSCGSHKEEVRISIHQSTFFPPFMPSSREKLAEDESFENLRSSRSLAFPSF